MRFFFLVNVSGVQYSIKHHMWDSLKEDPGAGEEAEQQLPGTVRLSGTLGGSKN